MSTSTGRSRTAHLVLTWTVPFLLFGLAMCAGRESIELAPGEARGEGSVPLLDLILFGTALAACFACFRWPYSALLTGAGAIVALMAYTDAYLDVSTSPLGGMVYLATVPLSVACGVCALVAFIRALVKLSRARRATTG